MKIVQVTKFGTLTFNADGGCHFDGWHVETDDKGRMPEPDEFGVMLFDFLAERTRAHMLARMAGELSTAIN